MTFKIPFYYHLHGFAEIEAEDGKEAMAKLKHRLDEYGVEDEAYYDITYREIGVDPEPAKDKM